ncbi:MAG TPA: hypothetical protein VI699_09255 [Candidatus Acidoferrales bacterium]|nr:hypothetical protein [Candidatus Acidoferrales bacterium]
MPKDEFDLEDPLELAAREIPAGVEHVEEMAECFIEEYRRMGWSAPAVYALFRKAEYHGPHVAFQQLGDARIRGLVEEQYGAGVLAGALPILSGARSGEGRE